MLWNCEILLTGFTLQKTKIFENIKQRASLISEFLNLTTTFLLILIKVLITLKNPCWYWFTLYQKEIMFWKLKTEARNFANMYGNANIMFAKLQIQLNPCWKAKFWIFPGCRNLSSLNSTWFTYWPSYFRISDAQAPLLIFIVSIIRIS